MYFNQYLTIVLLFLLNTFNKLNIKLKTIKKLIIYIGLFNYFPIFTL
jgi:hypothetical protein